MMNEHLKEIVSGLNLCISSDDDTLIIVDFNCDITESSVYEFCIYNLNSL